MIEPYKVGQRVYDEIMEDWGTIQRVITLSNKIDPYHKYQIEYEDGSPSNTVYHEYLKLDHPEPMYKIGETVWIDNGDDPPIEAEIIDRFIDGDGDSAYCIVAEGYSDFSSSTWYDWDFTDAPTPDPYDLIANVIEGMFSFPVNQPEAVYVHTVSGIYPVKSINSDDVLKLWNWYKTERIKRGD